MPELESKLQVLLVPPDPLDHAPTIIELRAGTGGDEASIFAGDLYRMYTKFCERNNDDKSRLQRTCAGRKTVGRIGKPSN